GSGSSDGRHRERSGPGRATTMLVRLIAQIRKEILILLRDPRSRAVLIGPPLVQLFVFAFAATLEVENVAVAVLDRDAGRWSHEIVERIRATRMARDVIAVDSHSALAAAVDGRDVLLGIAFQPDRSRGRGAGRYAGVQVVRDGRRVNSAQVARGYSNAIVADLPQDGLRPRGDGATAALPVQVVPRHLFNPNLD